MNNSYGVMTKFGQVTVTAKLTQDFYITNSAHEKGAVF